MNGQSIIMVGIFLLGWTCGALAVIVAKKMLEAMQP